MNNNTHLEKSKRANYTYQKLPQANKEPAVESVQNAKKFYAHINRLCEK